MVIDFIVRKEKIKQKIVQKFKRNIVSKNGLFNLSIEYAGFWI